MEECIVFSIRGFPHHNKFVCFFALCLSDCLMPHINNGHIDVYNKRLKSSGLRTRSCFFHSFFSIHRSMLCEKKPIHPSTQCRPTQRRWQRQRPNANQFVLCRGYSWITRARSFTHSFAREPSLLSSNYSP